MIHQVVKYLETNKRLVIPQLGAFVVKEAGRSVLFSEMLKRDDGVLRELLCAAGASQIEAAGEIDRFIFELRHAVECGEEVLLTGLGVMRLGSEGLIVFTYDPATINPCDVVPPPPATDVPTAESTTSDDLTSTGDSGDVANTTSDPILTPDPLRAEAPRANFCAAKRRLAPPHDLPVMSPSVKLNPEPCLKGLRYGKPKKNTNSYNYMDRTSGRRRVDRFLLVAIAAAVIAVAAIAFGYYHAAQERKIQEIESHQTALQPENSNDN